MFDTEKWCMKIARDTFGEPLMLILLENEIQSINPTEAFIRATTMRIITLIC